MTEPVTPTPISPLPPAPLITDTPEVFDDKAFPFAASLDTLRAQANVIAGQTNQNAVAAKEGAAAAVPAATAAVAARDRAETAANNAELSEESAEADADWIARRDLGPHPAFPTTDNQGRPIIVGAHFLYTGVTPNAQYAWDGTQWLIGMNVTAGVTQINGEAGAVILKTIGGVSLLGAGNIDPSKLYRSPRTSNVQLSAEDRGRLIDITSGTFTQTFAAAATLGDGWYCYLRNSGTGDITLDPNGAEQIDGLTSYVMYPGECRLVQCDGIALSTIVLNAFYRAYTSSGTFTKPPGYAAFEGLLWSAGGSGGKGASCGGGGGGACLPVKMLASSLGASETVTIGSGGASQASANTNGSAGGNSTFATSTVFGGSFGNGPVTQRGGSGGRWISAPSSDGISLDFAGANIGNYFLAFGGAGGAGYVAAGFETGKSSEYGGGGGGQSAGVAVGGGASTFGGGGGGGGGTGATSAGASKFGGAGGAGSVAGVGTDGTAPGGGGGGTGSGVQSGAGARGELRIWGII